MPEYPSAPTSNTFFPGGGTNLSTSSNTAPSGSGYQKWHTHYQVIEGMWKRLWQYDGSPVLSSGQLSGCPQVSFTYLDINVTCKVIEAIQTLNWDNSYQQLQKLQFNTDSSLSGWGTSGTFTTIVAGYWRDKFETGDTADNCGATWNVRAGLQPGVYNSTADTYAKMIGDFVSSVLMSVPGYCPRWQTDLVEI